MQKVKDLSNSTAILLDDIGGEPVIGSGFEAEVAETEFGSEELSRTERTDATEE
ncbi:MAG: hypothetical protein ACR2JB_23870 [Bryobacteraceae bacterium]